METLITALWVALFIICAPLIWLLFLMTVWATINLIKNILAALKDVFGPKSPGGLGMRR